MLGNRGVYQIVLGNLAVPSAAGDEAEQQNHKNDCADSGVKPVAQHREANDAEQDTADGRGNEQQNAKLDDARGVKA